MDDIKTNKHSCGLNNFWCQNDKNCISLINVCDGKDDCGNNEDEKNCKNSLKIYRKFKCENGELINHQFVCNFFPDCKMGEDEKFCSK